MKLFIYIIIQYKTQLDINTYSHCGVRSTEHTVVLQSTLLHFQFQFQLSFFFFFFFHTTYERLTTIYRFGFFFFKKMLPSECSVSQYLDHDDLFNFCFDALFASLAAKFAGVQKSELNAYDSRFLEYHFDFALNAKIANNIYNFCLNWIRRWHKHTNTYTPSNLVYSSCCIK